MNSKVTLQNPKYQPALKHAAPVVKPVKLVVLLVLAISKW